MYKLINVERCEYQNDIPVIFGGQKIYGKLDCLFSLRYIKKGQYVKHRVFFADVHTVIVARNRPCGVCMKKQYKIWKESRN